MTQETETTTLLQDLEDIVSQLQSGKIDEKQTIEVLNNIVNYEKEIEFKKNKNKRYNTVITFRFPFYHNYDIQYDYPKSIKKICIMILLVSFQNKVQKMLKDNSI